MRKQLRVERRPRRVRWRPNEVLPLDPRDLDVVRAKAWVRTNGRRILDAHGG
jgi:hypothetical protein